MVDDQHGQPTWSVRWPGSSCTLGRAAVAGTAPAGIYHGTAAGRTTWFDLARAVFAEAGLDPARVRPTTRPTSSGRRPGPAYSVLGHDRWARTSIPTLGHWRGMLAEALSPPTGPTDATGVSPDATVSPGAKVT